MGLLSALNQFNPFAKGTMADQVGDKYERYKVIIETFAPLLSGRIGENTPETTKAAWLRHESQPRRQGLLSQENMMQDHKLSSIRLCAVQSGRIGMP